jgi:hypothetical protein
VVTADHRIERFRDLGIVRLQPGCCGRRLTAAAPELVEVPEKAVRPIHQTAGDPREGMSDGG